MTISKETWTYLSSALAKMHAAFPAGDYHLNKRQNLAINALGDATAFLSSENKKFCQMIHDESVKAHKETLKFLCDAGKITEDEFKAEIKRIEEEEHARQKKQNAR